MHLLFTQVHFLFWKPGWVGGQYTTPSRHRKTIAREDRWIGNELKKDRFVTETAISKRANANLGIKISRHIISRRLNEINLNSRVASTKPYILKRKKWADLNLPLNISYGLMNRGIVFISTKFNLFVCDGRRFVWRSPKELYSPECTKSSVQFGGASVMVFGMISTVVTGPLVRLHGKINATVYKVILKKNVVPNLKFAINQPAVFMQITLRVTQRSLLRHFFLRRMLLL